MNKIVKMLESVGQKSSLNQYDSVSDMLNAMNVKETNLAELVKKDFDLVCGLVPEDDEDE